MSSKRDKYLRKNYGIGVKEYSYLFTQQNRVCAICQHPPKKRHLCVDHRHVKGYKKLAENKKALEIRGLLCFRCNKFLVGALESNKNPRLVFLNLFNYFCKYKLKNDL